MIKDIVVNLGLGAHDPAGDYAISVAEGFEAHVLGIAVSYEPVIPGTVMGGIPPEIIESQRREFGQQSALSRVSLRGGSQACRPFWRNADTQCERLGRGRPNWPNWPAL